MKKMFFACSLIVLLVSGCSKKEEYAVDYLVNNPNLLNQVLEDCKANKQTENNCKNANEAKAKLFSKTGGKKRQQW